MIYLLIIFLIILNSFIFGANLKQNSANIDIINVGINEKNLKEYEGQHILPNGILYNSFLILDEKIMIIDGVEKSYRNEWLSNIQKILNRKEPDFILIQHAEPDSSGSFIALMELYPKIKVVSSMKSFSLLKKY